jgi:hypothetical protein
MGPHPAMSTAHPRRPTHRAEIVTFFQDLLTPQAEAVGEAGAGNPSFAVSHQVLSEEVCDLFVYLTAAAQPLHCVAHGFLT